MQRSCNYLILFLLFFLFSCQSGSPQSGRVQFVYDGDTIKVNGQKVRLIGIDTPEVAWREKGKVGECFGPEAKAFLRDLLQGQTVRLEGDPLADAKDSHGRLLAWVYLGNRLINLEIVRSGYGFAFRRFPNSKKAEILKAEHQARQEKKGVWRACPVDCAKGFCEVST